MKNIGFIGLGIMGKPMVLNLLKAGFSVYVLEKSASAEAVNYRERKFVLLLNCWPNQSIQLLRCCQILLK
jgi:6-phosphogluconate dehydrogenase